jgi:hypothetical protein
MTTHRANENEVKVESNHKLRSGPGFRAAGEMPRRNVHSSIDASEGDK